MSPNPAGCGVQSFPSICFLLYPSSFIGNIVPSHFHNPLPHSPALSHTTHTPHSHQDADGGLLDADSLVLLDGAAGVSASASAASSNSEVQAPGAYRSLCVELRLHHLAVNAVDKVCAGGGG